MFLLPSAIHYMSTDLTNIIPTTPEHEFLDISRRILKSGDLPKIQVVQKNGEYFTLNNSKLEIFKRLEQEGKCTRVKVEVLPLREVPEHVREMMVIPLRQPNTSQAEPSASSGATGEESRSQEKGYSRLNEPENDTMTSSDGEHHATGTDSDSSSCAESDSDEDWSGDCRDSSDCGSSSDSERNSSGDERECLL